MLIFLPSLAWGVSVISCFQEILSFYCVFLRYLFQEIRIVIPLHKGRFKPLSLQPILLSIEHSCLKLPHGVLRFKLPPLSSRPDLMQQERSSTYPRTLNLVGVCWSCRLCPRSHVNCILMWTNHVSTCVRVGNLKNGWWQQNHMQWWVERKACLKLLAVLISQLSSSCTWL